MEYLLRWQSYIIQLVSHMGAWGGVVVKALVGGSRDRSPVTGDFSWASDSSMCPGVDSASKNEYQDIPGG